MTTKPNQPKRLYWYIVLATIVLGTRPKTADSKTIVAGSLVSQHALGVDQSDARAKRHLRSNSNTTKKIDGNNEDRAISAGTFSAIEEVVEAGTQKVVDYAKTMVTSNNQQTIDQHFKELVADKVKVDKNTKDLFQNAHFQKWSKSVDDAYKMDSEPAAEVAKISTLLAEYDEEMVVGMLVAAKEVPATKAIVENLEIGLLTKWAADIKQVDVDMTGKNPDELLFAKFKTRYSDEGLAKVLGVAKSNVATEKIATELEKLQRKHWKVNGKSIRDVFVLLKLSPPTFLKSPVLSAWVSYAKMLDVEPYKVLFLAMKRHLGDIGLAKLVAAAYSDRTNVNIAWYMEHLQFEKWSKLKKSGDDVFTLLGLKEAGENAPKSPLWNTWISYMTGPREFPSTQTLNPETLLFPVLRNQFSEEVLAKLVANAKTVESTKAFAAKWELEVWWITSQTMDQVFDLLKLKKKGRAIFESPEFRSWVSYVIKLNDLSPHPDKFVVISQLEKHYGVDLETMLRQSRMKAFGNKDKSTHQIVTGLLNTLDAKAEAVESLQRKEWLSTQKTPSQVFGLLN